VDKFLGFLQQTDAVGLSVAVLLLAMSVVAWVIIVWKVRRLHTARRQLPLGIAAFWAASGLEEGSRAIAAWDREGLLSALVNATQDPARPATLADQAQPGAQLTRRLRDALHAGLAPLQAGQVVLASIGSTAPFIGLFGTVWGIYHALLAMSSEGSLALDQVAGPVGEALVMTAAGLAVAIPAVLAYNLFGKWVADCEAVLEGFAHDLREWQLDRRASAALGSGSVPAR
jgi:biopolymer transport protein ExbB